LLGTQRIRIILPGSYLLLHCHGHLETDRGHGFQE
jgi:hypothetical protein